MNISNFDLNLLRAFDALMRERNVSRAAQRMSLTQPAMSNALNRLRELLNDPVLARTSKGMIPTEKALGLEGQIRKALTIIDQAMVPEAEFEALSSTQTFHIGTTDYVELALLPKLVQHLKQVAPQIKIETHSLDPDIPELQLETGEYDFALGRFAKLPSRLLSQNWRSEPLVCLVSADHPDYGDTITEAEFLASRQIWVNGGQRTGQVDQWLRKRNLKRNVVLTIPNFLMAPIIVARSDLLVVTPLEVASECIEKWPIKMLPLPMNLEPFQLDIIWHPLHANTPSHSWFKEQLMLMSD